MARPPLTVKDFLAALEQKGQTIADWARENDLGLEITYAVINGRALGRRGESRRVLQAMGVPLPPMVDRSAPGRRAA